MKLLAFSDWRIQNIEKLIEYVRGLSERPDFIIYAGDDIGRFNRIPEKELSGLFKNEYTDNFPDKNYFEELAKYSKHGLLAVAGNDDHPFIVNAICGKNVFNIYKKPFVFDDYVFIGIEGSVKSPGVLLHSEKEILNTLDTALKENTNKKIIIVSHTPPHEILDIGIRFGINHIGSISLRKFIDKNFKRIKIVFCGHAHSQGGKEAIHKGVTIINCASHDNEGEPGKICLINLSEDIETKWDLIYEWGIVQKEVHELMKVPLIGYTRATALFDMGIKDIEQLAKMEIKPETSTYPCFLGCAFDLIKNYAKAIALDKPIVIGRHPFFDDKNNIYFFDAEYDPVGTKNGPYGIFLLGIMNKNGQTKQFFLDRPKDEKQMLNKFRSWLIIENPVLVAYSSTSADKPQLVSAFKRFGISTSELEKSFFDLYYACINTQRQTKQFIFLPMTGSMSVKGVSILLGYNEPKNMKITDGLQALIKYNQFLEKRHNKTKKELLAYNKVDLERTRFVFNQLNKLMK